jgi:hypothetical protein
MKSQLRRFEVDRLNDEGVATLHHDELETEICLRSAMEPELLRAVQKVSKNSIGYTRKQEMSCSVRSKKE